MKVWWERGLFTLAPSVPRFWNLCFVSWGREMLNAPSLPYCLCKLPNNNNIMIIIIIIIGLIIIRNLYSAIMPLGGYRGAESEFLYSVLLWNNHLPIRYRHTRERDKYCFWSEGLNVLTNLSTVRSEEGARLPWKAGEWMSRVLRSPPTQYRSFLGETTGDFVGETFGRGIPREKYPEPSGRGLCVGEAVRLRFSRSQ